MTPKQIIYPIRYLRPLFKGDAAREEAAFLDAFQNLAHLPHAPVPLGRARTGIYLMVKSFITPARKKVVLSPYTIPDVINMIIFAGGEPVFCDHEPRSSQFDLNCLASTIDEQTACVMVTHYHINEHRLHEIMTMCEHKGVGVFEDCAISLGGTVNGLSVGRQTSGGVFSLSSYKFLNYLWGGVLYCQDKSRQDAIAREVEGWDRFRAAEYRAQIVRTLKYDLATRPLLFDCITAPLLRWKQRKSSTEQALHQPRIESTTFDESLRRRPSAGAFAEWNRKIHLVETRLNHRRSIAAVYDRHFREMMISANVSPEVCRGSCYVNYPVWVGPEQRGRVYREMILGKFDVGLSLYPNSHQHSKFTHVSGSTTEISNLCSAVLTLPTHPRVTSVYAEALAAKLKSLL